MAPQTRQGVPLQDATDPLPRTGIARGRPTSVVGAKVWETDRRGILYAPHHWASEPLAVLDRLVDYNPDVALADHVEITLALRGLEVDAVVVGPDGPTEDTDDAATRELAALEGRIGLPYGATWKGLLEAGMREARTQGGVGIELDVADSLDDLVDLDWVPRRCVSFRVEKENGHQRLEPVYVPTFGEPVPFSPEQFRYSPHRRKIAVPHGTSHILPVLETAFDQAQMRKELNRVLRYMAWGRLHLKVKKDRVIAEADALHLDDEQRDAYISGVLTDIRDVIKNMHADDVLVTYDDIEGDAVGATHGAQGFRPLEATQAIDQDHVAANKVQPALLGRAWGNDLSSTGSVQWQIAALSIEGLREGPAGLLEWALTQYLRLRGIRAVARVRFEAIRKEDAEAEARAFHARMQAWQIALEQGLVDREFVTAEEWGTEPPEFEPVPAASEPVTGLPESKRPEAEEERVMGHPFHCADCGVHVTPAEAYLLASETTGFDVLCEACAARAEGAQPFLPTDTSVASPVALASLARLDPEALAEAMRDWRRWAEENAPLWVGLLDAEEEEA